MNKLEMLNEALEQATNIVKHREFTDEYSKREQDFFKSYIVELLSDIYDEEKGESNE